MNESSNKIFLTSKDSGAIEILYELNGFQYFSNGKHTHHINYISNLRTSEYNKTNNEKNMNIFLNKYIKNSKILQFFYKKFQIDNIEGSIPLLLSSDIKGENTLESSIDIKSQTFTTNEMLDSIPEVVNPKAFINFKQLQLIALLTEKMNCDSTSYEKFELFNRRRKMSSKNNKDVFQHKYGRLLSVIDQNGSSGHIKIFYKKITNKRDFENSRSTYCKEGKIFYAVKEFKNKNLERTKENYNRDIISEFIIGNCFFGKCLNIINIFNLMEANNSKYIQVMELCPSGDLYGYVKAYTKIGRRIHVVEADCFMKQLLNGVSYMHIHGIAHCDIKLENILFYPEGLLKLCDFGNSSVFQTAWESNIHKQKSIFGTQPYLAPEEFKKEPYDPRISDCWSCGMVYITMTLGRYIWRKASISDDLSFKKFHDEMERTNKFHIFEGLTHIYPIKELFRKKALYKIFDQNPTSRISVLQLKNTPWIKGIYCCQE